MNRLNILFIIWLIISYLVTYIFLACHMKNSIVSLIVVLLTTIPLFFILNNLII